MKLCDVLGLAAVKKEEILDKEIEDLIAERQEARKAKNFARADEIRDELLAKGIILKDVYKRQQRCYVKGQQTASEASETNGRRLQSRG